MKQLAPAKGIQIKPGTADGITRLIKRVAIHSGEQRMLRQAVKMTELDDEKLASVVSKMSQKEKQIMKKALNDSLGRVVRLID